MSGEESVAVRGSRRDVEKQAHKRAQAARVRCSRSETEIRPAPGIGGELVDSREISFFKVGMLVENLLLSHSGTQPAEDIPDRDSKPADARLAGTLTRFDGDPGDTRCRHWKIYL
jgi:hypothetical protein